jgi:hypothetical protein
MTNRSRRRALLGHSAGGDEVTARIPPIRRRGGSE